jgi:LysM repeat protein
LKLLFEIEEIAMASMKRRALVASLLVLVAIVATGCNQPFSEAPVATNTPINPNSLFGTPLGQATNMADLENFATGTALAIQSGTPIAGVFTATPDANTTLLPGGDATITPTSIIQLPTGAVTTPSATLAVSTGQALSTSLPAATSVPGTRPSSWTLRAGEFPYCIARRFNLDPDQLLSVNGLSDGQLLLPGRVLTIPQTGTFPGNRMLSSHPATYNVLSTGETFYSIACKYGDVRPEDIAAANGMSVETALTAGQSISIP